MGSTFSSPPPDESFVTGSNHKLYLILPTQGEFIKLGYTSRPLKGLWRYYRRSYGAGMVIYRVYPCTQYKEDDPIHAELQPKYGLKNGGNELYRKGELDKIVAYLDKRYQAKGVGPYQKDDLVRYRDGLPPLTIEDYLLAKTKKLSLNPQQKKSS